MNESQKSHPCFNCARTDQEIPVISWRYQGEALWVCSECMPNLIHKWEAVVAHLSTKNQD